MNKGRFIVIEGQGFTGKSEQVPLLAGRLRRFGIDAIETQEPGGVEEAIKIREELQTRRAAGSISPIEELDLFYVARDAFLKKLVIPSCLEGKWVISSRFSASSFVYQGREGGISLDIIRRYEEQVVGSNKPDLYILLDVTADVVMARMVKGERERHAYNELDANKVEKRRKYYLELANEDQERWRIIDGNKSIAEVSSGVWEAVYNRFLRLTQ